MKKSMASIFTFVTLFGNSVYAQDILPRPEPPFKGKIGRTVKESKSDFPKEITPPKDAPNIVLILTDDAGFGASSTFGGPIQTPTFDRLAQNGLRYNKFHTTALCSPTRAALLTGRNHHSVATGVISEMATGYPGYSSLMPKSAGSMAEVLRQHGYSTAWFGKNHNVPDWQSSSVGPFDLWPTSLGFDHFYGFLGGDVHNYAPALYSGTQPIEPHLKNPRYHIENDLADNAIRYIENHAAVAPDKPFFVYYATPSTHAPHHAPKEWIAKFKGKFDQGWDKVREETFARQKKMGVIPADTQLTARPKEIPAWDSLNADQKKVYSRMMEVYAGALAHVDFQIGRVLNAVAEAGKSDNTIVIYIQGDNGASAEGTMQGTTNEVATAANGVTEDIKYLLSMIDELGGPKTYNHYPVGWALAMDTPFQWTKQVASHFGGTRNGMVISWPKRINDKGTLREQFAHVIDIAPTIYEVVGIKAPKELNGVKQKPIEGTSLAYTFNNSKEKSKHTTQYFEMVGNRAIYKDGWVAATTPKRLPWDTVGLSPSPEDFAWELYNVDKDFSESKNLAGENPQKLKELQNIFWREAAKYNVLPLDSSFAERADPAIRPSLTRGRDTFVYHEGAIRIPEGSAPNFKNRSYSITADIEIAKDQKAEGVLATLGGRFGGLGLLMLNGKPMFVHALSNQEQHKYKVISSEVVPSGRHILRFDFAYNGGGIGKGGTGTLYIDGKQVAQGQIPRTVGVRFSLDETFDVGEDTGTPVIEDYANNMPFKFTGTLNKLTVDLKPLPMKEKLAQEQAESQSAQYRTSND
ncbi:arylsulfatase [Bdellovibrio svalbardensis]|uniref:Arylsulfatase n=1 Tax=Bdellovibrio svalbardensis TaxID=2972972 RepID=A0ABT6DR84_9BACT|nr:arylsulfatase [Bdellovibrio svalbardensis]MDG0817668.1 arylsulfatase [Bdellovibrio svalbardensis]